MRRDLLLSTFISVSFATLVYDKVGKTITIYDSLPLALGIVLYALLMTRSDHWRVLAFVPWCLALVLLLCFWMNPGVPIFRFSFILVNSGLIFGPFINAFLEKKVVKGSSQENGMRD
jgi:hypothetical protein